MNEEKLNHCDISFFQLKQEMWETYQRLQSIGTVLRTYVNNSSEVENQITKEEPPPSIQMINISGALTDLSNLIHEALHAKVHSWFKSHNFEYVM